VFRLIPDAAIEQAGGARKFGGSGFTVQHTGVGLGEFFGNLGRGGVEFSKGILGLAPGGEDGGLIGGGALVGGLE
jgi:hypothetical protein